MSAGLRRVPAWVGDGALVVVLSIALLPDGRPPVMVALLALEPVPLLFRRYRPGLVMAAIVVVTSPWRWPARR